MHNDNAQYPLQTAQGYPVKVPKKFAWLIAGLMLLGWGVAQAHVASTGGNANDAPVFSRDKTLGGAKPFVPAGATIVAVETGDLNGDGRMDALLVINPPAGPSMPPSPEAPRVVMLLVRDANGHLQKAAENDKIVPCESCGGIAGGPLGYVRIKNNGFKIVVEGGSREHWWSEYTFVYASERRSWVVDTVQRGVSDTVTYKSKKISFSRKKLGTIPFENFDPSTLPNVTLP